MQKFLLSALNLGGILLVAIGVFIFANALSGRNFIVGSFRILGSADTGIFLIMTGLILFAASFIANKLFRKQF